MRKFVQRSSKRLIVRDMIEVAIGLGCAIGLSWWIPGSWKPSHLIFCAFFVVVFATAVRYHTFVAYTASLLAAVSYGVLLWQRPEMRVQPDFLYLALEPFLLLCSGIVISDLLHWQRLRLDAIAQNDAQINEALREAQLRYQKMSTLNEALERQITAQPTSVASISEKLLRLWSQTGDERFTAIVDIVTYAVEAQSCGLYMRQDGLWRLCAERSIGESVYAPLLNTNNFLVKRAIESGEVSTIRDALTEEKSVLQEGAVMAGPLLDRDGEVVGVVVIDTMPFLKFTSGTVRLFRSILQIVSIFLRTAELEREKSTSFSVGL